MNIPFFVPTRSLAESGMGHSWMLFSVGWLYRHDAIRRLKRNPTIGYPHRVANVGSAKLSRRYLRESVAVPAEVLLTPQIGSRSMKPVWIHRTRDPQRRSGSR